MINKKMILEKAEQLVRSRLEGDSSGHDWWHIVRVRNTARTIAMEEKADVFLCEMAALLHDMADDKLTDQPEVELAGLLALVS